MAQINGVLNVWLVLSLISPVSFTYKINWQCAWDLFFCDYPYNIEETIHFRCSHHHDCPSKFMCCSHRCFRHRICQPYGNTEDIPRPPPNKQETKPGECDITISCDVPLPKEFTKAFECFQDNDCPDYYKCCFIDCYNHKVCQGIKDEAISDKNSTDATALTEKTSTSIKSGNASEPTLLTITLEPTTPKIKNKSSIDPNTLTTRLETSVSVTSTQRPAKLTIVLSLAKSTMKMGESLVESNTLISTISETTNEISTIAVGPLASISQMTSKESTNFEKLITLLKKSTSKETSTNILPKSASIVVTTQEIPSTSSIETAAVTTTLENDLIKSETFKELTPQSSSATSIMPLETSVVKTNSTQNPISPTTVITTLKSRKSATTTTTSSPKVSSSKSSTESIANTTFSETFRGPTELNRQTDDFETSGDFEITGDVEEEMEEEDDNMGAITNIKQVKSTSSRKPTGIRGSTEAIIETNPSEIFVKSTTDNGFRVSEDFEIIGDEDENKVSDTSLILIDVTTDIVNPTSTTYQQTTSQNASTETITTIQSTPFDGDGIAAPSTVGTIGNSKITKLTTPMEITKTKSSSFKTTLSNILRGITGTPVETKDTNGNLEKAEGGKQKDKEKNIITESSYSILETAPKTTSTKRFYPTINISYSVTSEHSTGVDSEDTDLEISGDGEEPTTVSTTVLEATKATESDFEFIGDYVQDVAKSSNVTNNLNNIFKGTEVIGEEERRNKVDLTTKKSMENYEETGGNIIDPILTNKMDINSSDKLETTQIKNKRENNITYLKDYNAIYPNSDIDDKDSYYDDFYEYIDDDALDESKL